MDLNRITEIIAKIRHIYRFDDFSGIKRIVAQPAKVILHERIDSGKVELSSIEFDLYYKIVVTSNSVTFCPEIGTPHKILHYEGFDRLLTL